MRLVKLFFQNLVELQALETVQICKTQNSSGSELVDGHRGFEEDMAIDIRWKVELGHRRPRNYQNKKKICLMEKCIWEKKKLDKSMSQFTIFFFFLRFLLNQPCLP